MLNLKPIRDRLEGPFTPFVIHLSDGRVTHIDQNAAKAAARELQW